MDTPSDNQVLPYPLIIICIAIFAWPIFFTGQWDEFALIGFGLLLGLLGILWSLRSYPLAWRGVYAVPMFFLVWLSLLVATGHSAIDSGWPEYAWWVFGIIALFYSSWLARLAGFLKLAVRTLFWTQIVSALIAIFILLKDPAQRATGLLFNANGFGGYALWGVVTMFILQIIRPKRSWSGVVGWGIIFLTFVATVSVTAATALLLTGLGGLIVGRTWWNKKRVMRLAFAVLLAFGLGVGAFQFPRIRAMMDVEHIRYSFTQRLEFSRAAWQMGLDRPLTGWGVGSFQIVYPQYARQVDEQPRYPHNLFLQLFAETGAIGAGLWIFLVATIGLVGWKSWHRRADDESRIFRALWFGWLAFTFQMVLDFSWQFPAGQIWWWVTSGIFLGQAVQPDAVKNWRSRSRERIGLALIALAIIGWTGRFAFGLMTAQGIERANNSGNDDQEITMRTEALQWGPNRDRIIRLAWARWLRRSNGDLAYAQTLLERAIARNREDYSLYYWYGIVLRAQEKRPAALGAFREAYQHDPVFHLEHAVEYARELGRAGMIEDRDQVIRTTLERYRTMRRPDASSVLGQLEALRSLGMPAK